MAGSFGIRHSIIVSKPVKCFLKIDESNVRLSVSTHYIFNDLSKYIICIGTGPTPPETIMLLRRGCQQLFEDIG